MTTDDADPQWAVVELMGHQRIAGMISEHNLGGAFVRIDVPAIGGRQGFTKLFGPQAIYAINFVDQAIAVSVAESLQAAPVQPYNVGQLTNDAVQQRLRIANSRLETESELDDAGPF